MSRRETLISTAIMATAILSAPILPAHAADDDDSNNLASEILDRLGNIPTFCLVQPDGTPFMIFNGERSATGFFFLSYNMAQTALQDAITKDKNKEAGAIWERAAVRVVPLSVAMQLSLYGPRERIATNTDKSISGKKMNTYADIVMSEEGNLDARRLDRERKNPNPQRWSNTKGRIPVFHVDGMTTKSGKDAWYFNIADLKADYKQQHDGQALVGNDGIESMEMMDVFRKASRKDEWTPLQNIRFMPVPESKQVAVQIVKKQQAEENPYDFDKVFLVSSSK